MNKCLNLNGRRALPLLIGCVVSCVASLLLFIASARAATPDEPVTVEVILKEGNTISGLCASLARMRELPGSVRNCWEDTLSRNDLPDEHYIPAGAVMSVQVVPLPGETERVKEKQKAQPPPVTPVVAPPAAVVSPQQKTVVSRATAVAYGLGAALVLSVLTLSVALLYLVRQHEQTNKELVVVTGERDMWQHTAESFQQELNVAHKQMEGIPKTFSEAELVAELPVIIAAEYFDDDVPSTLRTSLVRVMGTRGSEGNYNMLFCELPWGERRVYDQRDIERAYYEHSQELGEALGIAVHFPPGKRRRFDQLFEKPLPSVGELVKESREAA